MPMSSSVLTARRRRHAILFVSSVSRESLLTVNDLSMSVIQTIAATTMIFNTLSRP